MTSRIVSFLLPMALIAVGCDEITNRDIAVTQPEPPPTRKLDLERPDSFLSDNFKKDFLSDSRKLSLTMEAITENGIVKLVHAETVIKFPYELITASRHSMGRSFFISSQPMSLDEAMALSQGICKIVKIDDSRLAHWFDEKLFEDVLRSNCHVSGFFDNWHHSISIRSSFESTNPWRVLYTLGFDFTERDDVTTDENAN